MLKMIFMAPVLILGMTSVARAGGDYCGTIVINDSGVEPTAYLAIFESIFFIGQVNRFKIVSESPGLMQQLKASEGFERCLDAELITRNGETVLVVFSAD